MRILIVILLLLILAWDPDGLPRFSLACCLLVVGTIDMPKQSKLQDPDQYKLEIRFGTEVLDAGHTSIPNLFLMHYAQLGISDGAAFLIVHLLRYKWTREAPYPDLEKLPMSCCYDTRRKHVRELRQLGLLFTRRRYWTLHDAPCPTLNGKLRGLEYHIESLIHNLVRIHNDQSLKTIELLYSICRAVLDGYYVDVPQVIYQACRKHITRESTGTPLILQPLPCENLTVVLPCEKLPEEKLPEEKHPTIIRLIDPNKTQGNGQDPNPELWATALEELRREVLKANYDTWIAPLHARWNDQQVCLDVVAPTAEHRDWLMSRASAIIGRAVANAAGRLVAVRYVTS